MTKQKWVVLGCFLILTFWDLSSMAIFHPQTLLLVAAIFVGLMLLIVASLEVAAQIKTRSLRRRGLFPPAAKATLEDVEALVRAKEKIGAIQLYRVIYRVSLQKALHEIDQISVSSMR